jgi:16S rRNA U516 pseudouridylate synthase RsuA-like enzyme
MWINRYILIFVLIFFITLGVKNLIKINNLEDKNIKIDIELNRTKDKLLECKQGVKADDFEAYFKQKEIDNEPNNEQSFTEDYNSSDDSYTIHI